MRSAWDKVANDLIEIRLGEAHLLRSRCDSGELECPLAGCPAPRLNTQTFYRRKNGTLVSDVFSHVSLGEGVHTPESIRHQDCKAAIVGWQKRTGSVNVRAERVIRTRSHDGRAPATKRRRPDVMSMLRNGQAMSFEVQTSTISASAIRDRTRDQGSVNRRVIWLFSWHWVSADQSQFDAHSTGLRDLIESDEDIWFLDPYAETGAALGSACTLATRGENTYRVRPRRDCVSLEVRWRPIDEYVVDPTGRIVTIDGVTDWPDEEAFKALERAEVIEAARAAAEIEARRQQAMTEAMRRMREAAEQREQIAALSVAPAAANSFPKEQRELRPRPHVSDLGGQIETVCAKENKQDRHVFLTVGDWKRSVAHWLIQSPGPQTFADINAYVMSICSGDGLAHSAVGAFVRDLREAGLIRSTPTGFVFERTQVLQRADVTDAMPQTLF